MCLTDSYKGNERIKMQKCKKMQKKKKLENISLTEHLGSCFMVVNEVTREFLPSVGIVDRGRKL